MPEYVIYRHGRNPANQPMAEKMPVAAVEAETGSKAMAIAQHGPWITVHEDQHLSAVLRSRAPADDWEAAAEKELVQSVILQHY
jgi:hypothetical protein